MAGTRSTSVGVRAGDPRVPAPLHSTPAPTALSPARQVLSVFCKDVEICYDECMIVGVSQITLHLPACHSLKEKRQVIKSLMARVRNQFEVAIAEVDEQDRWQTAVLGVTCVSNSSRHANEILAHVQRYIEEIRPDVLVTNNEMEIMHW